MSRFVRQSKFRHVFGEPYKKDECFDNVVVTKSQADSNFCAVNEKFVAFVTEAAGGGAFYVLTHNQTGKVDSEMPKIVGHKNAVLDVAWNPFNANMVVSGSDDCTAKIWVIPDGGLKEPMINAALTLEGHGRKVSGVNWHPSAEDILFTCSNDHTVRVWNVKTGEQVRVIEGHTDAIYSLSFNADGSKFVTTCKDKKLRVFNAHDGVLLNEVEGHAGTKASRAVWMTDKDVILTTGFSRQSDRQIKLWDAELKQLKEENIDTSSGVLMPFYDADLGIIYLAGKGDGNIRYYEITDKAPYVFPLSEYKSPAPQRGMGFLPKRACDVAKCEVARFYKLHPTNLVEPIRMIVPRKSDAFQEDIYPDCESNKPALSAADWIAGKNALPLRMSLRDGFTAPAEQAYVAPTPVAKPPAPAAAQPASPVATPAAAAAKAPANGDASSEIASLRAQLAEKDATIAKLKAEIERLSLAGAGTGEQ